MKIKKHISFSTDHDHKLTRYLTENDINFKVGEIISYLDIFTDDPQWESVSRLAEECSAVCLSETVFSKKELDAAEWLTLRSTWQNGYPMPDDDLGYLRDTYDDKRYCYECGCGLYQREPFKIKKTPSWGKRGFMMLNWVDDEIFVSDEVKEFLQSSELSGFHFTSVRNKSGKEILPNIYQMCVNTILDVGLLYPQECIRNVLCCPRCGKVKYHPNGIGMYRFKRSIFEGMPDVVKSNEWFGWGHGADRLIIVRNSFYRTVVENKMDRALEFQPIVLE